MLFGRLDHYLAQIAVTNDLDPFINYEALLIHPRTNPNRIPWFGGLECIGQRNVIATTKRIDHERRTCFGVPKPQRLNFLARQGLDLPEYPGQHTGVVDQKSLDGDVAFLRI